MGWACLISTTEEEKLVMSVHVHYCYIMESWIRMVCTSMSKMKSKFRSDSQTHYRSET